jgi:hypothetical protein
MPRFDQYIQRDYPGAVDVRGYAPEHVDEIVNGERTRKSHRHAGQ